MTKILLVEDDPMLQDIYLTKLKEVGFDVSLAGDGEKVMPELHKAKPDIMLLDIVLPLKDGWEVLSEVRKDPKWNSVKIVVLSNIGEAQDVEKGFALGADLYLIKAHFTPSQVVGEINKLLSS
ncbi:MAG: response regulator receiver protein [Parcubacteria group bacterium Greene0714_21]|nr:MAG: response regulator receiver protein [Parcubacteria group bacterium Greene0416_39]TSC98217.1 MAG: response regulator receiver protein [Parcubacteria group bacterium Greene1014_47]TSD04087.1 MAG: response regulator receiver protein [Parcubacteria group bacterium Greene0714_21]